MVREGERLLRMGLDSVLQEGPHEHGSDVVVEVPHDPLPTLRGGVQVFSWSGDVAPEDLRTKLDQLLAGWDGNGLDFGLLITTARVGAEARQVVRERNLMEHDRSERERRVRLMDGSELSDLYLKRWLAAEPAPALEG